MAFWFVTYNGHDGTLHSCEEREGTYDEAALSAEFGTSGPPDWTPSYLPLEIDEATYDDIIADGLEAYIVDMGDSEMLPLVVAV